MDCLGPPSVDHLVGLPALGHRRPNSTTGSEAIRYLAVTSFAALMAFVLTILFYPGIINEDAMARWKFGDGVLDKGAPLSRVDTWFPPLMTLAMIGNSHDLEGVWSSDVSPGLFLRLLSGAALHRSVRQEASDYLHAAARPHTDRRYARNSTLSGHGHGDRSDGVRDPDPQEKRAAGFEGERWAPCCCFCSAVSFCSASDTTAWPCFHFLSRPS